MWAQSERLADLESLKQLHVSVDDSFIRSIFQEFKLIGAEICKNHMKFIQISCCDRGITWPQGCIVLAIRLFSVSSARSCTCFFYLPSIFPQLLFWLMPSRLVFLGTTQCSSLLIIRLKSAFSGAWILWGILPPSPLQSKRISAGPRTTAVPQTFLWYYTQTRSWMHSKHCSVSIASF